MDNELESFDEFEDSDDEPTLNLDLSMMKQLASSRLDRDCVKTCRLTRGANSEIPLLQFDNGPDCIARLPRNSTNPATKLVCEVATMKYIAQNTKIKVPEVYDWDSITQSYKISIHLDGMLTWTAFISVDILFEIWTKCQFNEIGCLYMNSTQSKPVQEKTSYSRILTLFTSFEIGPIVNPLYYTEGRDVIHSFTGPFKSSREWLDALIQKEKGYFETHGVQDLITDEMNISLADAEKRTSELIKQLALLQYKISEDNPFESIDLPPFTLIHYDFDAQNILVEHSSIDNTIKIVGIIDWEFSHTGTLWELCEYPIWIQDVEYEPFEFISHKELQRNQENQGLRVHFRNEVIKIFGEKCGKILDTKEKDRRIERIEILFLSVHKFSMLERLLECFIDLF
ncbi:kinase-like domain-containing protein [Rhizophagus clarus]|uniref:Kinase-like domain-containing protein n=1 Tax=Rhizophagus clarus TaxID=94130 RepID=A0A8H3MG54_9GLOM|nr:kinase-like domain-containing protein [Rhizophagus clarus]